MPDGLLLLAAYGTACYVLGLITGARVIPWLVVADCSRSANVRHKPYF